MIELEILVNDTDPDVLCFSETWLNETEVPNYSFAGYTLVDFCCRDRVRGGGTVVYAKEKFKIEKFNCQVSRKERDFEYAIGKLNMLNGSKIIIVCLCRSPNGNLNIFLNSLNDVLDILNCANNSVVICGDFNVDFNIASSVDTTQVCDLMSSFDLQSHVKENTRITASTATRIDNIFSNVCEDLMECSTVLTEISDHFGQLLNMNLVTERSPTYSFKRCINEENKIVFCNRIKNEPWDSVNFNKSPNECFQLFHNVVKYHFDISFPMKKQRTHKLNKQWITPEIKEWSCQIKNLYWVFKTTQCQRAKQFYLQEKRKYRNYIYNYKKSLNDNKIINSNNITRETWNLFKNISIKFIKDNSISLEHNNSVTSDPQIVANFFNTSFTNLKPNKIDLNVKVNHVQYIRYFSIINTSLFY